jgi:cobalt-zinc-cadmium efflux system outer membrane protein
MFMNSTSAGILALSGSILLAGCAVQRYQPAPIAADATASGFQARTLADPGLQSFEESVLGHAISSWPPQTWDVQTLSLAALYFNPALDAARARLAGTQAALLTAGARPNPTLSIAPGIPSPYLLSVDFSVPLETANKRRYRVQAARSLDQAARFDLAGSAWTVHSAVRAALLEYLLAAQTVELLRSEAGVRADQVNVLERVAAAGEIAHLDVDMARIELSKTRLATGTAEADVAAARASLAAAIGIPVAGLQEAPLSWPRMESPPSAESFSAQTIQRDAVLNRLDVRSALAQYAAAEADLQLEIAKQYPDINLGPGYTYEERHSFFTVGFSTTVPLFNRNKGPIAEAEARRRQAAAAFLETQASVIAKSERAFAVYSAALKELAEADTLLNIQESQRHAMEQAVRLGEQDRLALAEINIQRALTARARIEALGHAQKALGELEDAVQRPLAVGDEFPVNPEIAGPE